MSLLRTCFGLLILCASLFLQQVCAANSPQFSYDKAAIKFYNNAPAYNGSILVVEAVSDLCHDCSPLPVAVVLPNTVTDWEMFDTNFGVTFTFSRLSTGEGLGSSFYMQLGVHAQYTMTIDTHKTGTSVTVSVSEIDSGDSLFESQLPILVAFLIAAMMAFIWLVILYVAPKIREYVDADHAAARGRLGTRERLMPFSSGGERDREDDNPRPRKAERLRSLDTFRGLSLAIMIFVNYGGGGYWYFAHSAWNGLTVADLVFPWFIFMMGCSMTLSFSSQHRQQMSYTSMFYKAVRRSAILFGLGILISNEDVQFDSIRIMGVLQRFSLSFLVVSMLLIFLPGPSRERSVSFEPAEGFGDAHQQEVARKRNCIAEITDHLAQWLVIALIVTLWCTLTFLLPVPDCPTGYLGPGGVGDQGKYFKCTGGAARYIDVTVLGSSHVYQHPTCQSVYHCLAHDPEGILGTLTSILMTFLGVQAGQIIGYYKSKSQRTIRWLIWAVLLGSIGILLSGATQNDGWIPINKNLWSLSFVLALAGAAFIMLLICYWLVDVFEIWNGAPFRYAGLNSIVIYVGSETLQERFPFSFIPNPVLQSTHTQALGSNLMGVSIWLLVAYYMYYCDFFIKI